MISIELQNNFIEITLRHGCSLVNLLYIFRTPFPKNTSGRLLLKIYWYESAIKLQIEFWLCLVHCTNGYTLYYLSKKSCVIYEIIKWQIYVICQVLPMNPPTAYKLELEDDERKEFSNL